MSSARRSRFSLFKKNSSETSTMTTTIAATTARPRPELSIPMHFRCPISLDLMKDPVTISTGITYDRPSIETWLEVGNMMCPVTKQPLSSDEPLVPNHSLRKMIQDWCVLHRSHGVERIPTPKIPLTPSQAVDLVAAVAAAASRSDRSRCVSAVEKLKVIFKESERNRKTIIASDAATVLSAAFRDLAADQPHEITANSAVLSMLSLIPILNEQACNYIAASKSLEAIVAVMTAGQLSRRLSAVQVMKELLASSSQERIEKISTTSGLIEALTSLVKNPISPNTTKCSLISIFYLCSSERVAGRFASMGMVETLLETLVDCDKSLTEKCLAVLDKLVSAKAGREAANRNALAVPVLVKKMIRVSDLATEFAVSALWKLCKSSEDCLGEALQVGVFQKLLLLLQVGCGAATKEKASDLLKSLNGSRANLECIESVDFKGLKRPF